jgi:hypothetical protein
MFWLQELLFLLPLCLSFVVVTADAFGILYSSVYIGRTATAFDFQTVFLNAAIPFEFFYYYTDILGCSL